MSLYSQLKRRNVHRMAALYMAAAWLVMQVVDVVEGKLPLPDWMGSAVLAVLVVGFPIALIISWFYEVTPEGISRDTDEQPAGSASGVGGRRVDFVVISLLAAAVLVFAYDKWWSGPPPENSIAVLPFDNHSNRDEDAIFANGIQDDLLTTLAKVGTLKVISRTSVERYRNSDKSIAEIASELDVGTLLEGGIQVFANQLRVNVQLIDARTDEHLWAETFDRELTTENLFAIQSEISREIVDALQIVLTDDESERLNVMPTTSLEAYAEYVLGHQELAKRTSEEMYLAQVHFENAISFDPDYALAYVGLADTLFLQTKFMGLKYEDSIAPRQSAIDKALELDPLSGEAYVSLAMLSWQEEKDVEAEANFLKAIELSPNYSTAHHWYNNYLRGQGRIEEALSHIRKAVELDPFAAVLTENLGYVLFLLGRVEEAEVVLRKGIERNPEFPGLHRTLSTILLRLGRVGEALNRRRAVTSLNPQMKGSRFSECELYMELGAYESAEQCIDLAEEVFPRAASYTRVYLHLNRSEREKAASLLEQLKQRDPVPFDKEDLALTDFLCGNVEEARLIWQDLWPKFYGNEDINLKPNEMVRSTYDIQRIVYIAYTLYVDGQLDRANYLFEYALETMQSMHQTRGVGYGEMEVFVHATRGDKERAISALREAIDRGWRIGWWILRSPYYDSMWKEPEWIELVNELEADITRQRQWYEEHKDKPLF